MWKKFYFLFVVSVVFLLIISFLFFGFVDVFHQQNININKVSDFSIKSSFSWESFVNLYKLHEKKDEYYFTRYSKDFLFFKKKILNFFLRTLSIKKNVVLSDCGLEEEITKILLNIPYFRENKYFYKDTFSYFVLFGFSFCDDLKDVIKVFILRKSLIDTSFVSYSMLNNLSLCFFKNTIATFYEFSGNELFLKKSFIYLPRLQYFYHKNYLNLLSSKKIFLQYITISLKEFSSHKNVSVLNLYKFYEQYKVKFVFEKYLYTASCFVPFFKKSSNYVIYNTVKRFCFFKKDFKNMVFRVNLKCLRESYFTNIERSKFLIDGDNCFKFFSKYGLVLYHLYKGLTCVKNDFNEYHTILKQFYVVKQFKNIFIKKKDAILTHIDKETCIPLFYVAKRFKFSLQKLNFVTLFTHFKFDKNSELFYYYLCNSQFFLGSSSNCLRFCKSVHGVFFIFQKIEYIPSYIRHIKGITSELNGLFYANFFYKRFLHYFCSDVYKRNLSLFDNVFFFKTFDFNVLLEYVDTATMFYYVHNYKTRNMFFFNRNDVLINYSSIVNSRIFNRFLNYVNDNKGEFNFMKII